MNRLGDVLGAIGTGCLAVAMVILWLLGGVLAALLGICGTALMLLGLFVTILWSTLVAIWVAGTRS